MAVLKRLFGKAEPQKPRVHICLECGMPVSSHKDWCPILQGHQELERRAAERVPRSS
jgi:hypothetical protein